MKTTIKLPIDPHAKLLVDVGRVIDEKTIVAELEKVREEKILHLSKLLHVKNERIGNYLKKNVGEKISIGEVIAEKKGLFSTTHITSPIVGFIKEMDVKYGTLTLETGSHTLNRKILSPARGIVVDVGKGYLEVEVSGSLYRGHKGEGEAIFGSLVYISGENIGTLDVDHDVEKKIVTAHSLKEESLVKLDVMGAVGLITLKPLKETTFSFLQVDEETLIKIKEHVGKKAFLRPEEKEIIIFD